MRQGQTRFPVDVHTGWADYSPALRYHAVQQVRSRLAGFAPEVRSVVVRISPDERHDVSSRRGDIEVMTDAGPISASCEGVDLFALVDCAVDSVVEKLRQRRNAEPPGEPRRRIA